MRDEEALARLAMRLHELAEPTPESPLLVIVFQPTRVDRVDFAFSPELPPLERGIVAEWLRGCASRLESGEAMIAVPRPI